MQPFWYICNVDFLLQLQKVGGVPVLACEVQVGASIIQTTLVTFTPPPLTTAYAGIPYVLAPLPHFLFYL